MAVVAITGTQRIVTVLFADVVGSTAIGEQVGPERSKFLFDEIVSLIGSEVRRFDGTVAQLLGDGLFAVFGAPVGHEDDAERAVRAALAIQDVICTYGEELRSGANMVHLREPYRGRLLVARSGELSEVLDRIAVMQPAHSETTTRTD